MRVQVKLTDARTVSDHNMREAGHRLRQARDRLGLTVREVEQASRKIAERHANDEFVVGISRLSEIENRGVVPTIYRLYSLCAIYRLDLLEVLEWFGVDSTAQLMDADSAAIPRTHKLGLKSMPQANVRIPMDLPAGIDVRHTTYLSRLIGKWGTLPLSLLQSLDLKRHRYAYIGTKDWTMFPLVPPGSLLLIDESRRKIVNDGWSSEYDRPLYFLEHRNGFLCGWCTLDGASLILQPHPASGEPARIMKYREEVEVVGQVTGIAMLLDLRKRRRKHSLADREARPDLN